VTERLLGLDPRGDYQPSIPFISLQAASLAVGRVLAYELDISSLPNLVQYDGLFGPQAATLEQMRPADDGTARRTRARSIASARSGVAISPIERADPALNAMDVAVSTTLPK
jgi:hypothetical protein